MDYLKEPLKLRNKLIKNRLAMPPMATSKSEDNGQVSEELLEYYDERAKLGAVGLIITEHAYIRDDGKASLNQMSISKDEDISGLKKLAQVIGFGRSLCIAQINHAGSRTNEETTGSMPVGPSKLPHPAMEAFRVSEIKELTREEITEITGAFVKAAVRAQEAGFSGVEIHSAHGYLLNQFYSPLTNKREDEYGYSTMENRLRFHKEVLSAVRAHVSDDFIIGIRLGGCDYHEGGSTIEDAVAAARYLEKDYDYISLTGGLFGYTRSHMAGPGYFRDLSRPIKSAIIKPVLLTGGVKNLEEADDLLKDGVCDLVGIGRSLFKDAHLADPLA